MAGAEIGKGVGELEISIARAFYVISELLKFILNTLGAVEWLKKKKYSIPISESPCLATGLD